MSESDQSAPDAGTSLTPTQKAVLAMAVIAVSAAALGTLSPELTALLSQLSNSIGSVVS